MEKCDIENLLSSITEIEQLFSRPLEDQEILYIKHYGKDAFLENVWGANWKITEGLYKKLLNKIAIACTTPTKNEYDSMSNLEDFFHTDSEYDNPEDFNYTEQVTGRSKQAIIDDMLKAVEKVSLTNDISADEKVEKALEQLQENKYEPECVLREDTFDGMKEESDDVFDEKDSQVSILDYIPDSAKKWIVRLTLADMLKVADDIIKDITTNKITLENKDEFTGEFVDRLKDMAIAKFVFDLRNGKELEISDSEILSELEAYLKNTNYKLAYRLCEDSDGIKCRLEKKPEEKKPTSLGEIITELDNGKEVELPTEKIDEVINYLWKTRDNVAIKVVNNKIKLG